MAGPGGLAGFGGGGFPGVMPGMGAMPPPIIPRGVANPLLAGAMMPGPGQVLVLAPGTPRFLFLPLRVSTQDTRAGNGA